MRGGGSGVRSARCRELQNARCRKHGELVVEEVWDTLQYAWGVHGPGVSEL